MSIFIVAYRPEATVRNVLFRILHRLAEQFEVEVLVIDDGSRDRTFERARAAVGRGRPPFPVIVLFAPVLRIYSRRRSF